MAKRPASSAAGAKHAMRTLPAVSKSMHTLNIVPAPVQGTFYLLSAALAAAFVYYLYALGQQPDPRTKCKDILPGLRKLMYVVAVFELVVISVGMCALLTLFGISVYTLAGLVVIAIPVTINVFIIRYTVAIAESKDTVKDQCTRIQANFRLFLMGLFGLAMMLQGGMGMWLLYK